MIRAAISFPSQGRLDRQRAQLLSARGLSKTLGLVVLMMLAGQELAWAGTDLARCESDADKTTGVGIRSCSAVIAKSTDAHGELAFGYAYRAMAYANHARITSARSEFVHAMRDAEQAIRINPEMGEGYWARSVIHLDMIAPPYHTIANLALWKSTIPDFSRAIELNPVPETLTSIYEMRGDAYRGLGENSLALQDYSEAVRLNSQNAGARYWRGVMEKQQGDDAAGEADMAEARRIDPSLGN